MKTWLYVVLLDVVSVWCICDDLMVVGIGWGDLYCLGLRGVMLIGLYEVSLLQKSDVVYVLLVGGYLGLFGGLALGVYLWLYLIGVHVFGVVIVAVCTVGGVLFGVWVASFVGILVLNWKLCFFDAEFAVGYILLMVDVFVGWVVEIYDMLAKRYLEVYEWVISV